MHDKIRAAAFDEIHAEEDLGANARLSRPQGAGPPETVRPDAACSALACCLLVLLAGWGGYHTAFTPPRSSALTSTHPSSWMSTCSTRSFRSRATNEDGAALAAAVEVKYLDYTQALTRILDSDAFAPYTSEDAAVSIAVFGSDEQKSSEMLSQVETCTAGYRNTRCYADNMEIVAAARATGLSCGKYRAYLDLHELIPLSPRRTFRG